MNNSNCTCTSPYYCPDENQVEPGYICDHCQQAEHERRLQLMEEEYVSISTVPIPIITASLDDTYVDDLPF